VIEEAKGEAPDQDGTARLFTGSLKVQEDYLLQQFDEIDEPAEDPQPSIDYSLSPDASRSTLRETVSRLSVGLLSYAKPKEDNSHAFTLGIDYKLEEDLPDKSPDELIEEFNDVKDLPADTINPAIEALKSTSTKEPANKKYC